MDAISSKKVDILKAFISLVDSGTDVTPFLHSNLKMILDCCYDDCDGVVDLAVKLLSKLAQHVKCRQPLLAAGTLTTLVDIDETVSTPETKALIATAVKLLKSDSAGGAAIAPAKKETRGVHLNMDGLLGKREHEDMYIHALLQVDGITSVTIDRTRSLAIVYTSEEREMKGALYEVAQRVCDRIRDAAGMRRIAVRKNDHATYLDEDEEEDDDEDFFAAGSKHKIIAVQKGKGAYMTAADRLRERDAATAKATPAAAAGGGGILGWLGLW